LLKRERERQLVRLLGTRFEARNCISEPCAQEPYRDQFTDHSSNDIGYAEMRNGEILYKIVLFLGGM
jgi:hypothetical protein